MPGASPPSDPGNTKREDFLGYCKRRKCLIEVAYSESKESLVQAETRGSARLHAIFNRRDGGRRYSRFSLCYNAKRDSFRHISHLYGSFDLILLWDAPG
jgi:hypothetical protein